MSQRTDTNGAYYQTIDVGVQNHGRIGLGWHCDCENDPAKAATCPRLRWYRDHPEDLIKHQAQS